LFYLEALEATISWSEYHCVSFLEYLLHRGLEAAGAGRVTILLHFYRVLFVEAGTSDSAGCI